MRLLCKNPVTKAKIIILLENTVLTAADNGDGCFFSRRINVCLLNTNVVHKQT